MRLDFSQCRTPEDVERVLAPLGPLMRAVRSTFDPAEQAYRDGLVHAMVLKVATQARALVATRSGKKLAPLAAAVAELVAAERLAGVDLTDPKKAPPAWRRRRQ